MTNAELIKALRNCSSPTVGSCMDCPYYKGVSCKWQMMEDAADALEAQMPKEGEWIMDENPHDGDCRCSACLIAIDAMHERNHKLLNALTGGKWWTFYRYCPNCGSRMRTVTECHTLESDR